MMLATKDLQPMEQKEGHAFHRVAIAQIDYNPAFASQGKYYLREPWPRDLKSLFFTTLTPARDEGKRLLDAARDAVAQTYIRMFRMRVEAVISWSAKRGVDLILFPEYSIPHEILPTLWERAKKQKMTVVAGTHSVTRETIKSGVYKDLQTGIPVIGSAVAPVLMPDKVELIPKLTASQWEDRLIIPAERWKPIRWGNLSFAVLICLDLLYKDSPAYSLAMTREVKETINFIVVPACTPARTVEQFEGQIKQT